MVQACVWWCRCVWGEVILVCGVGGTVVHVCVWGDTGILECVGCMGWDGTGVYGCGVCEVGGG